MAHFSEPLHLKLQRWIWRRLLSPLYSVWIRGAYGVEIGSRPCWVGASLFRNKGRIRIGGSATLTSSHWANPLGNYRPCTLETMRGAEILIGQSFSASACCIISAAKIEIGDRVSLGANVTIMDNDMHSPHVVDGKRGGMAACVARPVILESDVWVGAGAIILKGVRIGARSIVGAGVTLRQSVPPDSVVVGETGKIKSMLTKRAAMGVP